MKACYRKLPQYKYQLVKGFTISIPIVPEELIQTRFIKLDVNGELMIVKHYAWNGNNRPIFDTNHNMRASLVHDALYQLMRLGKLDYKIHRTSVDLLFRDLCISDGVSRPIAAIYLSLLKIFGERYAKPADNFIIHEICNPN